MTSRCHYAVKIKPVKFGQRMEKVADENEVWYQHLSAVQHSHPFNRKLIRRVTVDDLVVVLARDGDGVAAGRVDWR